MGVDNFWRVEGLYIYRHTKRAAKLLWPYLLLVTMPTLHVAVHVFQSMCFVLVSMNVWKYNGLASLNSFCKLFQEKVMSKFCACQISLK